MFERGSRVTTGVCRWTHRAKPVSAVEQQQQPAVEPLSCNEAVSSSKSSTNTNTNLH